MEPVLSFALCDGYTIVMTLNEAKDNYSLEVKTTEGYLPPQVAPVINCGAGEWNAIWEFVGANGRGAVLQISKEMDEPGVAIHLDFHEYFQAGSFGCGEDADDEWVCNEHENLKYMIMVLFGVRC